MIGMKIRYDQPPEVQEVRNRLLRLKQNKRDKKEWDKKITEKALSQARAKNRQSKKEKKSNIYKIKKSKEERESNISKTRSGKLYKSSLDPDGRGIIKGTNKIVRKSGRNKRSKRNKRSRRNKRKRSRRNKRKRSRRNKRKRSRRYRNKKRGGGCGCSIYKQNKRKTYKNMYGGSNALNGNCVLGKPTNFSNMGQNFTGVKYNNNVMKNPINTNKPMMGGGIVSSLINKMGGNDIIHNMYGTSDLIRDSVATASGDDIPKSSNVMVGHYTHKN